MNFMNKFKFLANNLIYIIKNFYNLVTQNNLYLKIEEIPYLKHKYFQKNL